MRFWCLLVLWAASLNVAAALPESVPLHGLSLYGDLKYPENFKHFSYVNPDAPKGGTVKFAAIGSFDNLNPFILQGTSADGLGLVYDTLTTKSADEAFAEYGLIAASITLGPQREWVEFKLRPEARFHDGKPITSADVVFSFNILRTQGHPSYRSYYRDVSQAQAPDPQTVRFTLTNRDNRELPLILGQLPVLPAHDWQGRDFAKTTLTPPVGSGPYRVAMLEPGRFIQYERVENYWARDLPVNKGRHNFSKIRYDYYRDTTVTLEAFKAGEYDIRVENSAKNWATGYASPALEQRWFLKRMVANGNPQGMQGFLFNLRRPLFQNIRVREALNLAFDFEWSNRTLFHGAYTRTNSYFANADLAATGLPSPEELRLLEPHRTNLQERVFTQAFAAPQTDGSGNQRANLIQAAALLKAAGWRVGANKQLVDEKNQPFEFEILLVQPEFERICLPYLNSLERLGIRARVRVVDSAQYENRLEKFDFDMTVGSFGQSLSPGNEQRDYWGSASAKLEGGRNLIGIQSPVVDALVDAVVGASDRNQLITATRALDRVLLWQFHVVPHWHIGVHRVAYWNKFGLPANPPPYEFSTDTWWVDATQAQALEAARKTGAALP